MANEIGKQQFSLSGGGASAKMVAGKFNVSMVRVAVEQRKRPDAF